jgi:hypothetical protein
MNTPQLTAPTKEQRELIAKLNDEARAYGH